MDILLRYIRRFIPKRLFTALQPPYHYLLALAGAIRYGFPSRFIKVVGITGTKGKSTTCEIMNAILEEAGYKTALASTIRFKIGGDSRPNLHKMTMPGRFFMQKFLREAVSSGCTWAVLEMTSEGAKQFRHAWIALDALIFTNLAPEHIESHGSYEKYRDAKLSLARALERSRKKNKILVVNGDDKEAQKFLDTFSETKVGFSKQDAKNASVTSEDASFEWTGPKSDFPGKSDFGGIHIESKLPGEFNLYNILAAATYAQAIDIAPEIIKRGIEKVRSVRGRAEKVFLNDSLGAKSYKPKADFDVIVDYAHTPDSLEKLYQTYAGKYRICVLGNTGGGRDKWKRPVMGEIAEKYCDDIILTNEDPYKEDPEQILRDMRIGMKQKQPTIILDRREAIRAALAKASRGDVVLITGKGTDPFIMGPRGSKIPWDDATVVREELKNLRNDGVN